MGLVGAPILALAVYSLLPAHVGGENQPGALDHAGRATAAIAIWMAVWWITEAIPLYATALLPLAVFPLFGIASMQEAAAPYAHELIYLFMGGFVLALSMQRWHLDRRIALLALQRAGSSPERIVGTFMGVTAILSMRLPGGKEYLARELRELGAVSTGEWVTLTVFGTTALAWITRPWLNQIEILGSQPLSGLTDPGIAICAALALFVIPAERKPWTSTMDWETANKLPWGLLVLFGGGLSLAATIRTNGLGEYLGHSIGSLAAVPGLMLVLGVVALMIFLTEITSNTATAAVLIPILAGLAPGLGIEPLLLIVPAAIAASCAFMLPVATPPNAVVFGSGLVPLPQMARAGIWLNLIGIVLITGLCYALVIPLLGVSEDRRSVSIESDTVVPPAMMFSPGSELPLARGSERG